MNTHRGKYGAFIPKNDQNVRGTRSKGCAELNNTVGKCSNSVGKSSTRGMKSSRGRGRGGQLVGET